MNIRHVIHPLGLYVSLGALCHWQWRVAGGAEEEGQESIQVQELGFKTSRRYTGWDQN